MVSAHDGASIAHTRDSSLTQLSCNAAEPPLDVIVITVVQDGSKRKMWEYSRGNLHITACGILV